MKQLQAKHLLRYQKYVTEVFDAPECNVKNIIKAFEFGETTKRGLVDRELLNDLLIKKIQAKKPPVVKTLKELEALMYNSVFEVSEIVALIKALGDQIPTLFNKNIDKLIKMVGQIPNVSPYKVYYNQAYESIFSYLPSLISTDQDISLVLRRLPEHLRRNFCHYNLDKVKSFTSADDLLLFLQYLKPEEQIKLLSQLDISYYKLLTTNEHLKKYLSIWPEDRSQEQFDKYLLIKEIKLHSLKISTGTVEIIKLLPEKQRENYLNEITWDHWGSRVVSLLEAYPPDRRKFILSKISTNYESAINPTNLLQLISLLPQMERQGYIESDLDSVRKVLTKSPPHKSLANLKQLLDLFNDAAQKKSIFNSLSKDGVFNYHIQNAIRNYEDASKWIECQAENPHEVLAIVEMNLDMFRPLSLGSSDMKKLLLKIPAESRLSLFMSLNKDFGSERVKLLSHYLFSSELIEIYKTFTFEDKVSFLFENKDIFPVDQPYLRLPFLSEIINEDPEQCLNSPLIL